MEEYEKDLKMVQDLEEKLDVSVHWDQLEGLIVTCMFELTKMNMSQTSKCHNFLWVKNSVFNYYNDRLQVVVTYSQGTAEWLAGYSLCIGQL